MEELQIPTRRITAEVFTTTGERLVGSLYLTASQYHTGGPEDFIELLNDERTFIPFSCEESHSQFTILSKTHIVRVHLDDGNEQSDGRTESTCTLWLADGHRLSGRVLLATPPTSSRLVDKFNLARRFLTVVSDDGIDFVHRAQIVRVE